MSRTSQLKSFFVKPVVLTASRILTDSDSGKTYFLSSASGLTVTLPSPRGGVNFNFVVKTANTGGNYVIASSANTIIGKTITSDVNSQFDTSWQSGGVKYVRLLTNYARVGDTVEIISDGTYWYTVAYAAIAHAVSITSGSYSPSISPSISPSVSVSISPSISPSAS